jgi:membrane protease YdiL (CAAX protease family)
MTQETPLWSYEDLMLFLGATLPAFLIATFAIRPIHFPDIGVQQVAFQLLWYVLLVATLYGLLARYRRPFWRSLGWTIPFRGFVACVAAGPVLAVGLAALAAVLHAPEESAIQNLVTDRLSRVVVMLFVALLGPIFEELIFRGFLLPLFEKSAGPWAAVIMTAFLFALLHGPTVGWAWQSILVIGLAGVAFGVARVATGSTTASTVVHVGYNSTLAAVFLLQKWV